ncbi:MAG: 1-(5-phosphoribosyl)-5-[(5-phosphoribosylamino)methylideneamino]imidazole-4-carboxamide isomerase [Clostridium sp.]|uniref:1-(5-phosphoribosyl)-5-[(5- phosphoribosylamino)methylideneamino]imidazole-4- carboxamide isomerase n=2 Tax=Clostridium sp. TaxID=1506 RepID=UPI002FC989F7
MIIFPAIDIRGGQCVRLLQGDFDKETVYGNSPADTAKKWEDQGAKFIHIVDLDGAKDGEGRNFLAIKDAISNVSIPVQVGGGIRTLEYVDQLIEAGAARVILGTAVIEDRDFVVSAVNKHGDKIAVSLDAKNGYVATKGWTEVTDSLAKDVAKDLEAIGVKTIVYTDIAKDGMLIGPNFEETDELNKHVNIDIIASGGVSSVEDVKKLTEMNIYGAIIGKALYDEKVSLSDF